MRRLAIPIAVCAVGLAGCGGGKSPSPPPSTAPRSIVVSSPAFQNGATLPRRFTCDGQGSPPPLRWSGVPRDAAELALLVEDPDAPSGTFLHWSLYGIAPSVRAETPGARIPGAREGKNSAGGEGYTGACPPKGEEPHRYVFTLYALKTRLDLAAGAAADQVQKAVWAAAIAQGSLTARYGR